jgi:hypothetical protein
MQDVRRATLAIEGQRLALRALAGDCLGAAQSPKPEPEERGSGSKSGLA